ncbi:hypothetical protein CDD83_10535 [Cordyceps sp. RAO-2017]|nr:hypothetical protein CDD83_10535 [Cordyceps sp. RAO-2017]
MQVNGEQPTGLTSPARLRKIDQLREKNIGTYLPLPQLVAVGDQSSGKSSLLESLTGIPFPRGQELCTRYATQITHRREEVPSINIGIIPGPHASEGDKRRLESYKKQLKTAAQLRAKLPSILAEINEQMGIRTSKNPNGKKTFSEDVLKIEKCGPQEDYLTVIDVPGIFRITTDGVTTNKDKELVRNMVKNYIRDSRTIVLAVLPCNVDVVTQEILAIAESYDKAGERTLGILTKPDLVKERSAQTVVCSLVKGTKRPLNLGYYLVRNRGGDDDDEAVDAKERDKMFKEKPWRQLPDDRVGIVALRVRLQELLGQITDRAFPKLRAETRQMLADSRAALSRLGPTRKTEREQQQYLAAIAGEFQNVVRAAIDADYSRLEAFADDDLRLITKIVNVTDTFNQNFAWSSCTYAFLETTLADGDEEDSGSDDDDSESVRGDDFPELESIIVKDWDDPEQKEGIMEWIDSMYRRSRGPELGTIGSGLLSSAFREQTSNWSIIARQYLSRIIIAIHRFILKSLTIICPDERVREELVSRLLGDLVARYSNGMQQAKLLVDIERQQKPYTLNHYFNSNLQKARGDRVINELTAQAQPGDGKAGAGLVIKLDKVQSVARNQSNEEHMGKDIHDILEAYYKVARKRFVDNLYRQAVDYCLLSGPQNPLALFSQQWVLELDTETLAAVAGESRLVRDKREKLQKTIRDLEEAIEILR